MRTGAAPAGRIQVLHGFAWGHYWISSPGSAPLSAVPVNSVWFAFGTLLRSLFFPQHNFVFQLLSLIFECWCSSVVVFRHKLQLSFSCMHHLKIFNYSQFWFLFLSPNHLLLWRPWWFLQTSASSLCSKSRNWARNKAQGCEQITLSPLASNFPCVKGADPNSPFCVISSVSQWTFLSPVKVVITITCQAKYLYELAWCTCEHNVFHLSLECLKSRKYMFVNT